MPLLAALFSAMGDLRRLSGRRAADRRRRRRVLVQHAGGGRFPRRRRQRRHQELRLRHRGQPDRRVRGLRRASRPPRASPARPRAPWSRARWRSWRSTSSSPRSCSGASHERPEGAVRMNRTTIDLWVGIFVATRPRRRCCSWRSRSATSTQRSAAPRATGSRRAFDNIGGLKVRAPVKAAGVVVGRVDDDPLDPKTFQAVVTLKIDSGYEFPRTPRVDPDLGPAGRAVHRPGAGGDTKMLGRRRDASARRSRRWCWRS